MERWSGIAFAQDQHLNDSLLTVLQSSKEDTNKVRVLLTICREKWKYAEYAEAKKYADEALSLSEKIGFKNGYADAECQIGIVFWYLKDNEKALSYHKHALALYRQSGNKAGVSDVLNRIGHDYADMPDYAKSLDYFQQALQLDEQLNNRSGVSKNLDLIGYIYMNLSDYDKALSYYFKALALAEAIGSKRGMAALGHDIGAVYVKQNKLKDALTYATKGLTLALQVGEKHLLDEAYSGLESIYLNMHNYKEAYNARLKYDELENVLRNADNAGKIRQMQMQYEFDKKVVSDSLKMVQEKEIGELKLQKQKAYTYGGFAGIVITILFLVFVYRSYHKQRIANQKLKEAQEQLIKSEKMAAFGVLASRVSHEILNPLNFVNNLSEVAHDLADDLVASKSDEQKKENADSLKESLQKINEHGKRAAAIVIQLRELSDKGTAHEFFEEN